MQTMSLDNLIPNQYIEPDHLAIVMLSEVQENFIILKETTMTSVLTKILISLLWAALGAIFAWLSFRSLQKQAGSNQPDSEFPVTQLPNVMTGRTLRLILVGVALYIAFVMNALYALVFVIALTVTTWLLVSNLNRNAHKNSDDLS